MPTRTAGGRLPEGWSEFKLGDLSTNVLSGGTPSTKEPAYWHGAIPWITSKWLGERLLLSSGERMISTAAVEETATNIVPAGSLIFATRVGVGKVCVNQIDLAINQDLAGVILDADIVLPDFVAYQLRTDRVQAFVAGSKRGATIQGITKSDLRGIKLLVPSIAEQRQIARVLSAVQRAIERQDRLIALTAELKKALMHKLFTEGTRGEPLKQTEIGPVPESWRVEKLGVLVNFSTGKLNANAAVPGGQYPFFTCSQETFAIDKYAFDTEAVLLSGNNARAVYSVKRFCGRFNAYQRTYVITIKDASRLEYSFLQWALEFNLERLRVLSIGSSTKYLTLGLLENLLVPIPELDEARNIGDALDSVSQRQARAERCAGTLRNLFRTLLHQLMTAQIRVHDLDLSALDEPARQPTRIT